MSLETICKKDVVTIDKKSTLKDVSVLMKTEHIGSVIVTEGFNGKKVPSGIITDRDLALALGSSPSPQNLAVEQIMQSQPVNVKIADGIFDAIEKMRTHGVKRLPVVAEDGSLYGIISADDLLTYMGEEINNLAKIQETQIKREQGIRMPTEKTLQF